MHAQEWHDAHDTDREVPRHLFGQHVPPPHRPDGRRAYIGQLVFHANGAALPADGLNGTQPQLNYHLDDFQNCIDLLRNEKPVYLLYNGILDDLAIDSGNVLTGVVLDRLPKQTDPA